MIEDNIKPNVGLADYTTFKIGGPAKFFVAVATKEELAAALVWAKTRGLDYFILGGGSNLLISDSGFDGLVIKLKNEEITRQGDELVAGAGARLGEVVAWAAEAGLAGLEWAAGIPGNVGGSVRGNAGAYGSDISHCLKAVEFFDTADNQFKTQTTANLKYGYRSSLFKQDASKIIWQATFGLRPGDKATISAAANKIIEERLARQPRYPSAGCVFKNLLADAALLDKLVAADKVKGGKVACGLIVEKLGFKGRELGGAKVSDEHANFVINYDRAKAQDVRALIEQIKQEAKAKLNLDLEEEIQYLGLF
jgi:UDP-N-acetylmuramate dehydrogenase